MTILNEYQRLNTSGARAAAPFTIEGTNYLAVPQLAEDISDQEPNMNGGDSDVDVIIYRWQDDLFSEYQRIPSHGNEDAEFFQIEDRCFLAISCIRSGSGPYVMNTYSMIYEWDGVRFFPFQQFPSFAAKQWRYFSFGDRHFLALANGVAPPGVTLDGDTNSVIYEWNGQRFQHLQTIPSKWAYFWTFFQQESEYFLAIADHIAESTIYRWNGEQFVSFQKIEQGGGRGFAIGTGDTD